MREHRPKRSDIKHAERAGNTAAFMMCKNHMYSSYPEAKQRKTNILQQSTASKNNFILHLDFNIIYDIVNNIKTIQEGELNWN